MTTIGIAATRVITAMTNPAASQAVSKLSFQSLWYLGGVWPIPVGGTVGNPKPEQSAIGALVRAGLAIVYKGAFGDSWSLTAEGVRARHAYLAGSACIEGPDGCCDKCGVSMVECGDCHGIGYHHGDCAEVA